MARGSRDRRRLQPEVMNAIDRAAMEVERQTENASRQPRFTEGAKGFSTFVRFVRSSELENAPEYSVHSKKRDQWLRGVWKMEPHLAGVVNSVTLIDSNRGWTLTGGRNQVARYLDIFHEADGGEGWRTFLRKVSQSYWTTDMGGITEIGRDGVGGPMRGLYHVDSARCELSGDVDFPLTYYPVNGAVQQWTPQDFFRVASMPSDDEAMRGLGFCAVSRCFEIVKLLHAVLMHDQEKLLARAPKGLLLLQGISEEQWNTSLEMREENLNSMERRYYGGVQILASSGIDQIDAKLVALSQLPDHFDARQFMDLSMYAFALCFGYDPSEFWPVEFGALGRGKETEVQHAKASGKGGLDFALHIQERLQRELPESLHFEFEQRDDQGELLIASVDKAKLSVVTSIYESGLQQGVPLITWDEARSLLAAARIIPPEWTAVEEDFEVSDTYDIASAPRGQREQLLDSLAVQRAMRRFPNEQIVQYTWPSQKMRVIWDPNVERSTKIFHPRAVKRQEGDVLYEGDGVIITEGDVDNAIAVAKRRVGAEFAQLLEALTVPASSAGA